MSIAVIETLWGVRKGESVPELMEAWDEYSVDENREGFNEACQNRIASWGDQLDIYRYIQIMVDMDKIEAAFEPVTVDGEIRRP
jgi:hypothetical protein